MEYGRKQCPKCGKTMEEGFTPEHTHGDVIRSVWVKGKPQKGFWTSLKFDDKESYSIATFRCASCYFIEQYAGEPSKP